MSLLAALRQQIIAHAVNDQNIIAKANNIPRYYPARKVSRVSSLIDSRAGNLFLTGRFFFSWIIAEETFHVLNICFLN